MSNPRIGAVIVLYYPNLKEILSTVESLSPQLQNICLIDNTPEQDIAYEFTHLENVYYIPLKINMGIASAQNIGIKYYVEKNYDFILFCDQDSSAQKNIVSELLHDYIKLKEVGKNIGLIGPLPINKKTNKPYHNKRKIIGHCSIENNLFIECQSIISSFSLVPVLLFKQIGMYKEELFIDFVDNEWCFRLKKIKNLSAYISTRLINQHELGKSKKFLVFNISISSPFRIYFQFRNYLWLRKIQYIPSQWKNQTFQKLLLKLVYYILIPSNRMAYMRRIFNGIRDGFRNPDRL